MEIHKYDMDKKMIRCYRIELILKEDSDSNGCLDYCEYLTRSCETMNVLRSQCNFWTQLSRAVFSFLNPGVFVVIAKLR